MCNSYFCVTPKTKHSTGVRHICPNNSKNSNWRQISLAGTDDWNSKLFTNIQWERDNHSVF